jgi:hypothetical protein
MCLIRLIQRILVTIRSPVWRGERLEFSGFLPVPAPFGAAAVEHDPPQTNK